MAHFWLTAAGPNRVGIAVVPEKNGTTCPERDVVDLARDHPDSASQRASSGAGHSERSPGQALEGFVPRAIRSTEGSIGARARRLTAPASSARRNCLFGV